MATMVVDGRVDERVEGAVGAIRGRAPVRERARLFFVDNLRVLLAILVVAHHAGQAYGPTGGRWPVFNDERAAILGPFFSVNAGFFMGLFFLVSAYFLPGAYDRKGAGAFLRDRLLRLGLPLAFFALAVFAPITYATDYREAGGQLSFWQYLVRVYLGEWQVELAHLWFVAHLLVYSLAYALWRRFGPRGATESRQDAPVPGTRSILLYVLGLALVTFVVRIWYPIDRWERLLLVVPAEVAHLPQYASLFVIGLVAARRDWFRRFPTAPGLAWLGVGLAAAVWRYAYSLSGMTMLSASGTNGRAVVSGLFWATWEALLCVGLAIGLVVLFRECANRQGRLLRLMAANTYGVYLIHVLLIVGLQFAVADTNLPPLAKFAVVTLVGVPVCFLVGDGLRRLPGLRRIL